MTVSTVQPAAGTAVVSPEAGGVPSRSAATLAAIREWRDAQQVAMEIVAPLVWTDVVPLSHWPMPAGQTLRSFPNPRMKHPQETDDDYRRRVEGAVASSAAIAMRGFKFGFEPPEALEAMFNIRGKIGMFTKRRMDIARGAGIEVGDVGQPTEESATCYGIDPVSGERVEITITMERARKAGWVEGNDNYRKNGPDMLWSRAMGRVLDRVAGHVLSGVVSVEDARDTAADVTVDVVPEARVSTATVLAAARPAPALTAAPPAVLENPADATQGSSPEHTEPETAQADALPPITEAQWRAINARFVELGVKGAGQSEARLYVIGNIVGMPVAQGRDLSEADAQLVLDNLTEDVLREHLATTAWGHFLPQPYAAQAADPVEAAQAHAASVEQQIADARAHADERAAQAAADEAQAADVDPTVGGDPWSGVQ